MVPESVGITSRRLSVNSIHNRLPSAYDTCLPPFFFKFGIDIGFYLFNSNYSLGLARIQICGRQTFASADTHPTQYPFNREAMTTQELRRQVIRVYKGMQLLDRIKKNRCVNIDVS